MEKPQQKLPPSRPLGLAEWPKGLCGVVIFYVLLVVLVLSF